MSQTIDQALTKIINYAEDHPTNEMIQYAASYAKAGIGMTGETLRVQLLYVQSNLQYYRGTEAKEVKQTIDQEIRRLSE